MKIIGTGLKFYALKLNKMRKFKKFIKENEVYINCVLTDFFLIMPLLIKWLVISRCLNFH